MSLASEGFWTRRVFLMAYNSARDKERLRMVEGFGQGTGLALLAVSMADALLLPGPVQVQISRVLLRDEIVVNRIKFGIDKSG